LDESECLAHRALDGESDRRAGPAGVVVSGHHIVRGVQQTNELIVGDSVVAGTSAAVTVANVESVSWTGRELALHHVLCGGLSESGGVERTRDFGESNSGYNRVGNWVQIGICKASDASTRCHNIEGAVAIS